MPKYDDIGNESAIGLTKFLPQELFFSPSFFNQHNVIDNKRENETDKTFSSSRWFNVQWPVDFYAHFFAWMSVE